MFMTWKKTLPLLMVLSLFGCSYGCSQNNRIQQEDSTEDYDEDDYYEDTDEYGEESEVEDVFAEEVAEPEQVVEPIGEAPEVDEPREEKPDVENPPVLDEPTRPSDYDSENEDVEAEEPITVEEYEDRELRQEEDIIGEEPPEEYDGMEYEDSEAYPEID